MGEITTPVPPAGVQYLPYAEGGGQIAVERRVAISGDELTDANQGFDPQDNRPVVNIRFDSQGGRKFANLSTQFTGRRFAIIVDNVVISAPSFNEPIPGGSATDQRQLHRRKRQHAGDLAAFGPPAGRARGDRGADRSPPSWALIRSKRACSPGSSARLR